MPSIGTSTVWKGSIAPQKQTGKSASRARDARSEQLHQTEFQYYIDRIEEEDSFHALIEAGDHILPRLESQFQAESAPERRTAIIRIIREYRNPKALALLTHALSDPVESVWQEALNGIVTIGGEEAIAVLRAALSDSSPSKREWITEAIKQCTP